MIFGKSVSFISSVPAAKIKDALTTTVEKNGYQISINWKEDSKSLNVRGMIKEGNLCKRLKVKVYLKNEKGGSASIEDIVNYSTTHGKSFKGRDSIYKKKGSTRSNKSWHVNNVYLNCLK